MTMPIARPRSRTIRAGGAGWPRPAMTWAQPARAPMHPSTTPPDWTELRYHHVVPSPAQWQVARHRPSDCRIRPVPSLITDYYSYNTDVSADDQFRTGRAARAWFQPHWVGDLTLSLRLTAHEPAGKFRLELIRAGISHRCEIDLTSGKARLFRGDVATGRGGPDRDHPGRRVRFGIRECRWPADRCGSTATSRSGPAELTIRASSRRPRPPPISSRRGSPRTALRSRSTGWS